MAQAPELDIETLRRWLTEGKPVTVVDVRSKEDRETWSIPGSVHADVYEALRDGRFAALAALDMPPGAPVVTVCNRGKVSRIAAELLRARGVPAISLEGGMQAWSLAWNIAKVSLPSPNVRLLQVRRTGKGCLSYIVASENAAAVIDASLEPEVYIRLAEEYGWNIRHVLDTHVHADHLSRSRALAERTGASLLMPAQNRVRFDFTPLSDGDAVRIGAVTLSAVRTPGHTEESTCYRMENACLFTGDTLFLQSVGRPDLHANEAETRRRARLLFRSLIRLQTLSPELLVLPGHSSEPVPFDGVPLMASLGETLSRLDSWLVSEDAFITRLFTRLPPAPPNYRTIVELNESGATTQADAAELEAGANRCAAG